MITSRFPHVIMAFLLLSILTLSGCATMELPDARKVAPTRWQKTITKQGVKVTIDPWFDVHLVEEYFGINPLNNGVVIVRLILENKTNDKSYFVDPKNVILTQPSSADFSNFFDPGVDINNDTANAAFVTLIALVGSPLFFFAGAKAESDMTKIKQNFDTNQIRISTLSPGKVVDGFVYFRIDKNRPNIEDSMIKIKLIDSLSGEHLHIDQSLS